MIVRSTVSRMQWVDHNASVYPELLEELRVDRRWLGKVHKNSRYDTRSSFAAWELVLTLMEARAYNRRGASTVGPTMIGAIQDVARAYGAYMRHPAFRRLGVQNRQALTFPAWDVPGEPYYSPRPVNGGTFVYLVPEWHGKSWNSFTTWVPGSPYGEDRLAHEETHRRIFELRGGDVLSGDPQVGGALTE